MTNDPQDPVELAECREALRRLVDAVWNAATDSEEVPDTPWADALIDKWQASRSPHGAARGVETLTDRVRELEEENKRLREPVSVEITKDRICLNGQWFVPVGSAMDPYRKEDTHPRKVASGNWSDEGKPWDGLTPAECGAKDAHEAFEQVKGKLTAASGADGEDDKARLTGITVSFDDYLTRSLADPKDAAVFLAVVLEEFGRDMNVPAFALAIRTVATALEVGNENRRAACSELPESEAT